MITLKQFLETIDYKISDGSEYLWQCYGPHCRNMTYWDDRQDGVSFSCYYDTKNQTVYHVEAHDFNQNRAYRWSNPEYQEQRRKEALERGVNDLEAYDTVKFIELDSEEDWMEKARAIFLGQSYDTRVSVPLELDDATLFELMKQAHERDITLNQLVEEILWAVIKKEQV